MIISGGSNIYPREIEEVLLTPSRRARSRGRRPAACRLGRGGHRLRRAGARARDVAAPALDQLCLDNIARFKRPKDYRFVDALPKNNYGKILKTELRQLLEREG